MIFTLVQDRLVDVITRGVAVRRWFFEFASYLLALHLDFLFVLILLQRPVFLHDFLDSEFLFLTGSELLELFLATQILIILLTNAVKVSFFYVLIM